MKLKNFFFLMSILKMKNLRNLYRFQRRADLNILEVNKIELIWKRIVENEGKEFKQKREKIFTYSLIGKNTIKLSTTNRSISKSQFEKALNFVPLDKTTIIQNLQAPSYIYGILMDDRIRKENW